MVEEHRAINLVIERMKPLLQVLETDPAHLPVVSRDLGACARELDALFTRHLKPEEEIILPAMRRYLPPDAQEVILAEMRRRRGTN